ncbi:2-pyrone-4,6-dicarboxylate hydrolase [Phreatobacter aquaticus]|uniref:2-pyrone-4,6-dicarboxylate hydrolase n=1 Tax=Phreatobacter aquaticus TaxID=2570229 RepID=A0A4D7QGI4_9HYPH|nr:amidohydrolase family protein [Phreatobacter aquaticus]QCK84507.1 2-pyrone-4,6-dicarboxylate hydrolase [Phreatobacter aquaticus]
MATYLPFDPAPRSPVHPLPAGACDSQFHVLGPRERYPVREGAVYEMPTATVETAMKLHKTLGVTRGVIVQPTTYGADHTVTLDGLAFAGPNYRGCANAAVFTERDDAYLAKLDAAGIKGARFTRQGLGIAFTEAEFDRIIARVRELGWYIKVQPEIDGIIGNIAQFERLDVPLVIDHMGRPDPTGGASEPSLAKTLELLKRGNVWVMLSLTEKISKAGPPWADVIPVARALIEAAPDRVIWGSDWPHPVSVKQPPNEGALLDFIHAATADDAERKAILVDNPARLFGF